MEPVRVRCNCCKGSGAVELTGVHLETYRALEKAGETWAAKLAPEMNCKPEAMSNRLAVLEAKGVAVHRAFGRMKLYRVAERIG